MLYVLTGGARSGKSSAAEALAVRLGGRVTVVATGRAADDEMEARIRRHRERRDAGWRVIELERVSGWEPSAEAGEVLLLECVGTMLARLMEEAGEDLGIDGGLGDRFVEPRLAEEAEARALRIAEALASSPADVVVVTNEVGDGVVPRFASARAFRDAMGRVNRRLVDAAAGAWLVVAGRCIELSALPTEPAPAGNGRTGEEVCG